MFLNGENSQEAQLLFASKVNDMNVVGAGVGAVVLPPPQAFNVNRDF